MGTRQDREMDGEKAAAQQRVELLRVEREQKCTELDGLLRCSETLHPSAYAVLQGQLEEEMEKLQAELNILILTAEAG